jgi:hypothetical protein
MYQFAKKRIDEEYKKFISMRSCLLAPLKNEKTPKQDYVFPYSSSLMSYMMNQWGDIDIPRHFRDMTYDVMSVCCDEHKLDSIMLLVHPRAVPTCGLVDGICHVSKIDHDTKRVVYLRCFLVSDEKFDVYSNIQYVFDFVCISSNKIERKEKIKKEDVDLQFLDDNDDG